MTWFLFWAKFIYWWFRCLFDSEKPGSTVQPLSISLSSECQDRNITLLCTAKRTSFQKCLGSVLETRLVGIPSPLAMEDALQKLMKECGSTKYVDIANAANRALGETD